MAYPERFFREEQKKLEPSKKESPRHQSPPRSEAKKRIFRHRHGKAISLAWQHEL
jgi:hypothetical protein